MYKEYLPSTVLWPYIESYWVFEFNKYLKEMEKIKKKAASLLQKCEVVVCRQ